MYDEALYDAYYERKSANMDDLITFLRAAYLCREESAALVEDVGAYKAEHCTPDDPSGSQFNPDAMVIFSGKVEV